jgi:SRSO17 transposase
MALTIPHIPQELFETTQVDPSDVEGLVGRLHSFARSFAPFFYRKEQAKLGEVYLEGLASDLHRKSVEPIAIAHHRSRQGLQRFAGQGKWEDAKVRGELHRQVARDLGDPDGILVIDGSGFPKKGKHSAGVARQWCNRLGKTDNCQVGVFIAYHGRGSSVLVDGDLYLPHEWTRSRARLDGCHVPQEVRFRTKIQLARELHELIAPRIPHGWTVGDDEFGRPTDFRRSLRRRGERYVLEVPSNTVIRDLDAPLPARKPGRRGRTPQAPQVSISQWTKALPDSSWTRVFVRDGEKGPLVLDVATTRVRTRTERKREGPREILVVTRTLDDTPEVKHYLSNADAKTPRQTLAQVAVHQHRIEESFQLAKDDIGMDHYEVRSWLGWQHHMTMSFLGHWFVTREHRRLGEKISRPDGSLDGQAHAEGVA